MKKTNDIDIFWGFSGSNTLKTKKFYICKTGGLSLWIGLNSIKYYGYGDSRPTREEKKAIVLSFPYDVSDCKCRNCRYLRMVRKLR